jgi:hypothetical protein
VATGTLRGGTLRFIELMPLTRTDVLTEKNFLPIGDAMRLLGHGPARYYLLKKPAR